jgi:hypothetical protein
MAFFKEMPLDKLKKLVASKKQIQTKRRVERSK